MQDESQHIIVGQISGIHGVRGWLKIISYTRPRNNIFSYPRWFLKQDNNWQEMILLKGQPQGKGLIAQLEGVEDRDQARTFLNAEIAVERSQLTDVMPGEYYWQDLIGLEVCNQQNKNLGHVKELLETGANDVLVIEGEQRTLIPFIKDRYVLEIDLENSIIRVDWDVGDK